MKKILFAIAAILLIGAGCSQQTPKYNSKSAGEENKNIQETTTTLDNNLNNTTDLVLNVEAVGNKTLKLNWQVSDKFKNNVEGYGLTLSKDPNPQYPGTYWYQRGSNYSDFEWTNLPTGTYHVRACVLKLRTCEIYSNDVTVDIK